MRAFIKLLIMFNCSQIESINNQCSFILSQGVTFKGLLTTPHCSAGRLGEVEECSDLID